MILVIQSYKSTAILENLENISKCEILKFCENLDSGIYKLDYINGKFSIIESFDEIPNLKDKVYSFIRIYNNGDKNYSVVKNKDLYEQISYNIAYRFGCALFLNGICIYSGYLNEERSKNYEIELLKDLEKP